MKPIKTFGLVALAALMAMAFAGVTSAMASEPTALCSEDPGTGLHEVCAKEKLIKHVHEVTLSGHPALLKTSLLTLECDVLFLGDVLTASLLAVEGAKLLISGNLTYSNCNNSCIVKEENGPAHVDLLKTGHELAEATYKYLLHIVCGGFIDCSYVGTGLKGHALGPLLSKEKDGEVTLTEQSTEKEAGGFLCPKVSKLTITTTPLETPVLELVHITE